MNLRWRMLLWEQGRTAGLICLTFCGLSVLHGALLHYNIYTEQMALQDTDLFIKFLLLAYPAIAAFLMTIRQNSEEEPSFDFEPRLLRLPMPIQKIFIVVIGSRIAGITAILLINSITIFLLPRTVSAEQWAYVILPLYFYLIGQAVAWSYKRVPVITDAMFLLALAYFFLLRFIDSPTEDYWTLLAQTITHPTTLILVPPLCIALMAYGIYLERRDEHFGPPNTPELLMQLNHAFSLSGDKVRTPMEAQLWYENRIFGRLMPLSTAVLTILILLLTISAADTSMIREGYGQYIPLAALVIAAALTGQLGAISQSRYRQLRPLSDGDLASIQMLAQLRALFFSSIIAGILSFLLFMAGTEHIQLLTQFREQGFLDYFDILMTVLRPLFFSTLIACLFLSPLGFIVLHLFIYFFIATIFIVTNHAEGNINISRYYPITYIILAAIILYISGNLIFLRKKHKTSSKSLVTQCCIGAVITLFIWYGSEQAKGASGILAALTFSALLLSPIGFNTFIISRRRHNAVK